MFSHAYNVPKVLLFTYSSAIPSLCNRETSLMRSVTGRSQLPEEILSLIVRASIPEFDICISRSYRSWTTSNSVRPQTAVVGIQDLNYLRLVNKTFCALVWSAVRIRFTGRLTLENLTDRESDDDVLMSYANELLTGALSHVATCVRAIDVPIYHLYSLSHLRLELLTGLKILHFNPPTPNEAYELLIECELGDALTGKLDERILACVVANISDSLPTPQTLKVFQDSGIRLLFEYSFYLADDNLAKFFVDVTKPDNPVIQQRIDCYGDEPYTSETDFF